MFEPLEFSISKGLPVCGVDEAGRGPLAGPLSIALVHFPKEILSNIWEGKVLQGLDDSKKLTEKKREKLFVELLSLPISCSHVFLSNRFLDRFGLSDSIFWGIQKLVRKVRLEDPYLLIDGNYDFTRKFVNTKSSFPYTSIVKGDSRIASIAAASIIAKVKRDRYMVQIAEKYPEYELEKHKGYGSKKHIQTIQKLGASPLHRKSFLKNILEKDLPLFY